MLPVPYCIYFGIVLPAHVCVSRSGKFLPDPLWRGKDPRVWVVGNLDTVLSSPVLIQVHAVDQVRQVNEIL